MPFIQFTLSAKNLGAMNGLKYDNWRIKTENNDANSN
jgi:hypothetical protein